MSNFKVVAILDMSAGNEHVGEMWQETCIFESTDTIEKVMRWAVRRKQCFDPQGFVGNLKLTIATGKI